MAKLNFQHHYSSHDPSEIILICRFVLKKHFLLLSILKSVMLLNIGKGFFDEWNFEQHFFETEIFSKMINVFTVTFELNFI